jgi:hypothetical protein
MFAAEDMEQVAAPIGEPCTWCMEPIAEGDYGVTIPHVTCNKDGTYAALARPLHWECHVRTVVGSVAHQLGICSCVNPNSDEHDPPSLTRREAAKAVASLIARKNLES